MLLAAGRAKALMPRLMEDFDYAGDLKEPQ
jgi:hypothetical protein